MSITQISDREKMANLRKPKTLDQQNKMNENFHIENEVGLSDDISGSTVIIPTISIGNVPQLANDLLIQKLNMRKIGHINSLYLYPFASPVDRREGEPNNGSISTALDIFFQKELNIVIVHQRVPVLPGFVEVYVKEVIKPFFTEYKLKDCLIISSADAGMLSNGMMGTINKYSMEDLLTKYVETLHITEEKDSYTYDPLPKYVKLLLKELNLMNLKAETLVSYVYEGDNFKDAEELASQVLQSLSIPSDSIWPRPMSWFGVYGTKELPPIAIEEGLYG